MGKEQLEASKALVSSARNLQTCIAALESARSYLSGESMTPEGLEISFSGITFDVQLDLETLSAEESKALLGVLHNACVREIEEKLKTAKDNLNQLQAELT